jgi:anionic cell wall polymer biosynthesis LytR-Cps2A-Psr (LCP) family protein
MVASWNPDENNVTLFSIPRDLYVKSPVNGSYGRINAIFQQYYSRTQSVEESALGFAGKVGEILGLDIPYYATIDFQTFKEIVDSL